MRLKLIEIFFLISCCVSTSPAQTVIDDQREDAQFWNETQIIMPMNERIDLMLFGVLRIGRDLARPVDERGGAGVAMKPNKFLTIIPTWLYIAQQPTATSKNIEHRLIFNATFKFTAGKFAFTDRNLLERRLRNRNIDFTMYRNRLQIGARPVSARSSSAFSSPTKSGTTRCKTPGLATASPPGSSNSSPSALPPNFST